MAPRLAETTHTAEIEIPAWKTTRVRVDDPMIQMLEVMRTDNRLSDRKGDARRERIGAEERIPQGES